MLNIVSRHEATTRLCDGIARRKMLQIGALGAFGLSLPQLLRAEQNHALHPSSRSKNPSS
ncbi:MAG: hypothetical protein R3C17_19940 [Planctomycetaceae bacterium]